MSLPTWEIVIITIIAITVTSASIYVFVRCWKSIKTICRDKVQGVTRPHQHQTQRQAPAEVYGVPYRPPDVAPTPLNAAKLQAIVMEGKSDLHPYYLEKKEHLGNPVADCENVHRDHKVTWRPDDILIESEFMPSKSIPVIRIHHDHSGDSNSSLNRESPKPKKKVHFSYDKGVDGAPEITSVTTEENTSFESTTSSTENAKTGNTDHTKLPVGSEREVKVDDMQVDNVSAHVPRQTWVQFDNDVIGDRSVSLPELQDNVSNI